MSPECKTKVYKTIVRQVMTYGSETERTLLSKTTDENSRHDDSSDNNRQDHARLNSERKSKAGGKN